MAAEVPYTTAHTALSLPAAGISYGDIVHALKGWGLLSGMEDEEQSCSDPNTKYTEEAGPMCCPPLWSAAFQVGPSDTVFGL